ncbi:MAG: exonuclease domain-containing protein [Ignavibacteriaceae bacterium]|nr:exonuclease domain-containing protein [Ignavibacteriaceae bacterium]MCW8813101.1 exonuclease domain-containing protein [Chlorobium sp.]MCW8818065.1 exonuclease domain-containing protein [Ignavibacteriaceae bacterium]MCW8824239.1 exonuclease domain-containing protein [Ignavibacteriaceae bacterium]
MITSELPATPLEEAEFSVLDVETTGLSARNNRVIEIGIVKVKNLKIADKYSTLINPGCDIPYFITQFTGISNGDVAYSPSFNDTAEEIEEFIGNSIISGHNLSFDENFLRYEFIRNGYEPLSNLTVCTLKLSRKVFPSLKSKSLASVTGYLKIRNKDSHRALSDAEATAKILIKLIMKLSKEDGVKTLQHLIEYQSSIIPSNQLIKLPKGIHDALYSLPDSPGVYYFLNKKDEVIYVGKAKSLKGRVRSYFAATAVGKPKRIVKQAAKIKTEITNSELTALLLEAESIKVINPKHNRQLKKYGNKYFIRINKSNKYPKPEISSSFDFDGNDYFGLFVSRRKAEVVLNIIDKTFALRECNEKEFKKGKKCFLADIERCTAPCAKKNDPDYFDELEKVYEFLSGGNQSALDRMLNKMKDYSSKEKYEKAAETKEVIDLILSQTHKSSLLAEPVNKANVLFEIAEGINHDYILLLEGKYFIKKEDVNRKDNFESAIDDYYSNTIRTDINPTEEDLEKMKISLNWLTKNRNKVRIFYLKDFDSKEELFGALSSNKASSKKSYRNFNIKKLAVSKLSHDEEYFD